MQAKEASPLPCSAVIHPLVRSMQAHSRLTFEKEELAMKVPAYILDPVRNMGLI